MTKKGNQHFIPRCYQKAWCDESCPPLHEPYVWLFDKETKESQNKAPGNILLEKDMYTITGVEGTRDLAIEDGLAQLEGKFAAIRNMKLNRHRELNNEEWVYLCAFIAAMHARTPTMREHQRSQWSGPLEIMDDIAEKMKTATVEQKRSMSRISNSGSSDKNPSLTHEQVRALVEEPLQHSVFPMIKAETPLLAKLQCTIFTTESSPGFITTDHPVVWFDPEAHLRPPMYRDVGIMHPTIEITMPLSPKQCIVLHRRTAGGYLEVSDDVVVQINRRNIHYADKKFIVNQHFSDENWFT